MQAINITVINPWFMIVFLGTEVACVILIISTLIKWRQPGAVYVLIGSVCYLVGAIAVTMVFNVPLNEALAIAKPDSMDGTNLWTKYLTDWTFWNHIRAIAAMAAATLMTLSLNVSLNVR